jgi:DNA (cytosine-5)-methyltransferase 1
MSAKPRLLDLFCCQGGASTGYHRAGFDVTGVDFCPQPLYPFEFVQADALDYVAEHGWKYDAITASPPCQSHSWSARGNKKVYPDFLPQTRFMLNASGKPFIIENVIGAPMKDPIVLCGTQFGLRVFRHRQFESNIALFMPSKCSHKGKRVGFGPDDFVSVAGHGGDGSGRLENWRDAMGIDWMDKYGLTQSIPPAYTHFLGLQLLNTVRGIQILERENA